MIEFRAGAIQLGEHAGQLRLEVPGAGTEFLTGLVERDNLGLVGLAGLIAFPFGVGSQLVREAVSGSPGTVQLGGSGLGGLPGTGSLLVSSPPPRLRLADLALSLDDRVVPALLGDADPVS